MNLNYDMIGKAAGEDSSEFDSFGLNSDKPSSSTSNLESDFLICKLCSHYVVKPKLLPCLHSFCTTCLASYVAQSRDQTHFICPQCLLPAKKQAVSSLPTNHFLDNLSDLVGSTHPDSKHLCTICGMQGQKSEAHSKCVQCGDFLCHKCAKVHTYTKYTARHSVLSMKDLQSAKYRTEIRANQKILCPFHDGHSQDIYCMSCEQLICALCASGEHRSHNCCSLDQAINRYRSIFARDMQKLRAKIKEQNQWVATVEDRRRQFASARDKVENEIRAHAEKLRQLITQGETELLREIEQISGDHESKLDQVGEQCEGALDAMLEAYDYSTKLLRFGRDDEVVSIANAVCNQLDALCLRAPVYPPSQSTVTFVKDEQTEDFIRISSSLIGVVDKRESGHCRLVAQFSCKSSNDKHEPQPSGLAYHPNGNLVVADYNNKKLKTFDSTGKLRTEFNCDFYPWDVCSSKTGKLVYTEDSFSSKCQLSILGTDQRTLLTRSLSKCRGVALTPDQRMILASCTEEDSPGIYILQLSDGKLLGRIDTEVPLKHPWYVATMANGSLLVSDRDREALYCFSPSGHLTFTVDRLLRAVAVDGNGHVVAIEKDGSGVILLSPHGKVLRTLFGDEDDGVVRAKALAVSPDGHLVIGEEGGMIKMFRY